MTIIDRDMLGLVFDIERFLVIIFGLDYLYETCAFSFCFPRGLFGQTLFYLRRKFPLECGILNGILNRRQLLLDAYVLIHIVLQYEAISQELTVYTITGSIYRCL